MQPHRIVEWQTAVCLLVTGKIDVLEVYEDEVVSSPSTSFQMPSVARIKRHVGSWKKGVKFSRINVYTRDNFECGYCGKRLPPRDLSYDHVIPRARGGKTEWENILTACKPCNDRKADRSPEQAGMRLLRKPYRPKTLPMTSPFFGVRTIPETWWPYIGEEGTGLSLAI
jgi:5-methylcytosine-specific restriction endonuclease McrA